LSRVDGRAILRAWAAVQAAGVDLFEPGARGRLPRVPGWSALGLPRAERLLAPTISVIDALRALALQERSRPKDTARAQLIATVPGRGSTAIPTREAIREVILSARRELLVIGFSIKDDEFRELVIRRGMAGVQVTVVGDRADGGGRRMLTHWPIAAAALTALEDVEPPQGEFSRMHGKAVVADRRLGIIGSANFTRGGLNRNIEFGVRVEGEAAARLVEEVERLRVAGWLVQSAAQ